MTGQSDRQPVSATDPLAPLVVRTLVGMLLYVIVDVLSFWGYVASAFVNFKGPPAPFSNHALVFLTYGGGIALLLLPLVYWLLRRPRGIEQFPVWRRTLVSFWLGFVSFSVLLPCGVLAVAICNRWLDLQTPMETVIVPSLVMFALILIIAVGCILVHRKWFAIGLLSVCGLLVAISVLASIDVPHEVSIVMAFAYVGLSMLIWVFTCFRTGREAVDNLFGPRSTLRRAPVES